MSKIFETIACTRLFTILEASSYDSDTRICGNRARGGGNRNRWISSGELIRWCENRNVSQNFAHTQMLNIDMFNVDVFIKHLFSRMFWILRRICFFRIRMIQIGLKKPKIEQAKLKKLQQLFKGCKFFLNREVPRESLTFIIRSEPICPWTLILTLL